MLKDFVQDAAQVLDQTGHPVAKDVASMLAGLDVDGNWQASGYQPALASLPSALAAPDCHPAAARLGDLADKLAWTQSSHPMPASFAGKFCFVTIVGPGGMIEDHRFRFGVYLQIPGAFYPAHRHEAEELYFPLSGTALWQKDDAAFAPVAPGTLIRHAPFQSHATRTLKTPLLALWSWTGNLSFDTYSVEMD